MPYRVNQSQSASSDPTISTRAARERRFYGTCSAGLSEWGLSDGERCGVREDILAASDLAVGDNIRVRNEENGRINAFIIHATYEASHSSAIRMVKAGRDRFYADTVEDPTPSTFEASFAPHVPNPNIFRSSVADADGECYERWRLDATDTILITAPHGGQVENNTEEMAQRCADVLDTSVWTAEGFAGADDVRGAFSKWHITSTAIDGGSWTGLETAERMGGWETVVSYHGYSQTEIAVGGLIDISIRRQIADALNANAAITANAVAVGPDGDDAGAYSAWWGESPDNFVNWLSQTGNRGIQLEFPSGTRSTEWRETAETIANVLTTL